MRGGESSMAFKRYTVRLFPNKDQEKMFWKHIHACRFIWNYMIDYQALNKKLLNVHLGRYELSSLLTMLKHDEEYSWINEVSRHSLVIVCTDLSRIYDRYHRGLSNLPNYKTKKGSKNIFPIRDDHNATYFKSFDCIQIPKCGKVKCRFDYRKISINLQSVKLRNPRIYFTNNEKWILSFAAEIDKIDNQDFMVFKNGPLGIDMGIKNLAVISYKDMNGNELKVNDGNTFVHICPTNAKVDIAGPIEETSGNTTTTNNT